MSAALNAYLAWRARQGGTEPPPPPDVDQDSWWTITDNSVTSQSEITAPKLTGYNLWFAEEEFGAIRSSWNNAEYAAIKTRLQSYTTPVGLAIVGNILGGTDKLIKCTQAYDGIIAKVNSYSTDIYRDDTKDAFTVLYGAYYVHDWCKGVVSSDKKKQLWSAVKSRYGVSLNDASIYADQHRRKLASHSATFYQHLPAMAVSFCDQDNNLWPALMRDMFAADGGRVLLNYFLRSGRSAQGNYTAVKMGGFLAMEAAFKKLIPPGKTMFSPYTKHLAYKLLQDTRNNRLVWNDGELNDNHLFNKSLPSQKLVYMAHTALYADRYINKAIDDLDNLAPYSYDQFVINPIYDATLILKGITPAASYDEIPKVGKSHFPLSRITYKTAHLFNENDTQAYYATDFKMDEIYTGAHDALDTGSVQFAGLGGWLLIGDTGAFSGTFSKHGWNWFRGALGRAVLITKDARDKWAGRSPDIIPQGGVRLPLDYIDNAFEPETVAHVENPARGSVLSQVKAYATNDEFNPAYVYAKADLSKAYQGDNKTFFTRLNWYTRQKVDFKTDVAGTGIQGMSFVIDKFQHANPANGYYFNWPCTGNPTITGRRAQITYNSASVTKPKGWLYCAYPDNATYRFASGWEGMAPSNEQATPEQSAGQRLETHPYTFVANNRFIHIFVAGDSTMNGSPTTDCKNVIGTGFQVSTCKGKGVLFNTEDMLFEGGFTFTMPETADMVFTDFPAGSWTVNGNNYTVSASRQSMYYPALSGTVTIAKG